MLLLWFDIKGAHSVTWLKALVLVFWGAGAFALARRCGCGAWVAWPVALAGLLALQYVDVTTPSVRQHDDGPGVGRDSLILMLAFPGALFFSFPYSESFYFVLVMAFFWGLELRQPALTGLAGFLLPLARPVGVFVLLPLAWRLYEERGRQNQLQPSECKPTNRSLMAWLLLACPLLGYAAYFGLMRLWTGNALEGFDAQRSYPNSPSIQNLFNYAGFFRALSNVQTLGGMMHSMLDRFFFVLFLALLPLIYRLDKTWFFYVLPAGLVPALSSWFMSYRRYIVVLFPLFVVLAQLLARTRQRWIFWYYVALLALLQVWAVRQFVSFDWAG